MLAWNACGDYLVACDVGAFSFRQLRTFSIIRSLACTVLWCLWFCHAFPTRPTHSHSAHAAFSQQHCGVFMLGATAGNSVAEWSAAAAPAKIFHSPKHADGENDERQWQTHHQRKPIGLRIDKSCPNLRQLLLVRLLRANSHSTSNHSITHRAMSLNEQAWLVRLNEQNPGGFISWRWKAASVWNTPSERLCFHGFADGRGKACRKMCSKSQQELGFRRLHQSLEGNTGMSEFFSITSVKI